jgi:hypothetical protein
MNLMLLLLQLCSHIVFCALPLYATSGAKYSASINPQQTTVVAEKGSESYAQLYFQNSQTEENTEEVDVTEESRLYTLQDYTLTFTPPFVAAKGLTQYLESFYFSIPLGIKPDPPQNA